MSAALLLAVLGVSALPLRIAVLSDRTGGADDAEFAASIEAVRLLSPDLVVTVGDHIEGYGDADAAREEWEDVMAMMAPLESAFDVVYTPGNHDIWDEASEELWTEVTGRPAEYVHETGGVTMLVWDTSRTGAVTPEATDHLREMLDGFSPDDLLLLLTHRPLWLMADQDSAEVARLRSVIEGAGVDVVLAGHIHCFAADRREGTLYVAAGPSGTGISEERVSEGIFTQVGWLTVLPDTCLYATVESHGVHPPSLNTGREELLAYLYRTRMIDATPRETELESASVTFRSFEDTARTLDVRLETHDWYLEPETFQVELPPGGSVEVHLAQGLEPGGSELPLPVMHLTMTYGPRDKELTIRHVLPLQRVLRAPDGPGIMLDGRLTNGEYPRVYDGEEEPFIGRDGAASPASPELYAAAVRGDTLIVAASMPAGSSPGEDDLFGLLLLDSSGWRRVDVTEDGCEGTSYSDGWGGEEWSGGWAALTAGHSGGWSAEVAVDLSSLDVPEEGLRAHLFRLVGDELATWSHPLSLEPDTPGLVWTD